VVYGDLSLNNSALSISTICLLQQLGSTMCASPSFQPALAGIGPIFRRSAIPGLPKNRRSLYSCLKKTKYHFWWPQITVY